MAHLNPCRRILRVQRELPGDENRLLGTMGGRGLAVAVTQLIRSELS